MSFCVAIENIYDSERAKSKKNHHCLKERPMSASARIQTLLREFDQCESFEDRCQFITDPQHLRIMSEWLVELRAASAPAPSVARAAFGLMLMHSDAGEMLSQSPIDFVMRDLSAQFVDSLKAASEGLTEGFAPIMRRCRGLLAVWRERDRDLTLRFLMDDVVLAKSDGRPSNQVETLFEQIRSIGGVEAETQARLRHDRDWQPVQAQDLEQRLADAYRVAFWDSLREEVAGTEGNPPSFERLFAVLQELKDALKALVAHSDRQKAQIDEHFDVDWLKQQADHRCLDTSLIHHTMRWVSERIVMYQAAADTSDALAWAQRVERDTSNDARPFPETLPVLIDFMRDSFTHVEKVYSRVLEMTSSREGGGEEKKDDQ